MPGISWNRITLKWTIQFILLARFCSEQLVAFLRKKRTHVSSAMQKKPSTFLNNSPEGVSVTMSSVFYFLVALLYYTVYNQAFFIIRFWIGYGIYNIFVCLTTRYHLYIFTCTMTLHTPFVFCSVDISRSRALLPTERVPALFIWNKPTHRSGTETINGSTGKNKQL